MKKIMIIFLITMAMSCQNKGDKNQSAIKVRETDSAIKANNPGNDAAGSNGRNDTGITPNQVETKSAGAAASKTSSGKDSAASASKDSTR